MKRCGKITFFLLLLESLSMSRQTQIQRRLNKGKRRSITELQEKLLKYTQLHFVIAEHLTERLADLTGKSKDRIRSDAINEALNTGDLFTYYKRELTIWGEDYAVVSGEVTGIS